MNLVSNALKFTHKGEVFLNVALTSLDETQVELKIEVIDSGIGIPEDKKSRLFQAFSQVDSSTTRKYGGTGLGLAISQRLIKLMGAQIEVSSEIGKGSSFSFNLVAKIGKASQKQFEYASSPENVGKKVLVVDDNATNLSILKAQLNYWKLTPTLVSSAKEALALIDSGEAFHVIISDLQMPVMDGVGFATAVKSKLPEMPIILLSPVGDESRSKFPHLFNAVLNKPVKQQQLFETLQTELTEHVHSAQPAPAKPSLLSDDFAVKHPLNILLVEDNLINQKLALRILSKLGYAADLANNGREAVAMVAEKAYEVILMDVLMPEMDGLEATRYIRKNFERQPKIVAMTANALTEDREACLEAGMDDYITKPINLEILISVLKGIAENVQG
jgi:CheY-like chemotaxis protein